MTQNVTVSRPTTESIASIFKYIILGSGVGDNRFLLGGAIGNNAYLSDSTDGVTWANISPSLSSSTTINDIVRLHGLWLAVGSQGGHALLLTSVDGLTWTVHSQSASLGITVSVEKIGTTVVSFNDSTSGYYIRSIDNGTTWTEHTLTSSASWHPRNMASNGSRIVIVGDKAAGGPMMQTTVDGVTWTEITPAGAAGYGLRAVCWTGSVFVASGFDSSTHTNLLTSADGLSWTSHVITTPFGSEILSVNGRNNLIVAVGTQFGPFFSFQPWILSSADSGGSWTERTAPTTDCLLFSVATSETLFVITGEKATGFDNRTIIFTSPTGTTWTAQAGVPATNTPEVVGNIVYGVRL